MEIFLEQKLIKIYIFPSFLVEHTLEPPSLCASDIIMSIIDNIVILYFIKIYKNASIVTCFQKCLNRLAKVILLSTLKNFNDFGRG